jgi:hypothetical protein
VTAGNESVMGKTLSRLLSGVSEVQQAFGYVGVIDTDFLLTWQLL